MPVRGVHFHPVAVFFSLRTFQSCGQRQAAQKDSEGGRFPSYPAVPSQMDLHPASAMCKILNLLNDISKS